MSTHKILPYLKISVKKISAVKGSKKETDMPVLAVCKPHISVHGEYQSFRFQMRYWSISFGS